MKNINKLLILILSIILLSLTGCVSASSTSLSTSQTSSTATSSISSTSRSTTTYKYNITLSNDSEQVSFYYYDHRFDVNKLANGDVEDLIQAVYTILSDANICVSYSDSKNHFHGTDKDPNNSSNFLLFYSGISVPEWDGNNYMSREHVWPQSLGHSKTEPGGHDLYNLRPEHRDVNTARGDKVYGMVYTNKQAIKYPGNSNIICGYYSGNVFEPSDAVKGDVARICFYYSIKYKFDLSIITSDDTFKELLDWNRNDPPSETEINRNNYVQEIQGNRNIFVDYPELADIIWG